MRQQGLVLGRRPADAEETPGDAFFTQRLAIKTGGDDFLHLSTCLGNDLAMLIGDKGRAIEAYSEFIPVFVADAVGRDH